MDKGKEPIVDVKEEISGAQSETSSHNNDGNVVAMYFDFEKYLSYSPTAIESRDMAVLDSEEKPRVTQQQNQPLDGSDLNMSDPWFANLEEHLLAVDRRRAKSDARLAEIALVDPPRAGRILANRQSALRSKENKMHEMEELEEKVETLRLETVSSLTEWLSSERENIDMLSAENEMRLCQHTMEHHVQLQSNILNLVGAEIQQMNVAIIDGGQAKNIGSSSSNDNLQASMTITVNQFRPQLQIQSQQQRTPEPEIKGEGPSNGNQAPEE